ncbi:hypothetical protein, partial [Thermogutta sp.]|uniref:hypothetical protein n=1 Tax=Thermogutta sp. TaxID=1962930 RepID=UPI003C7E2E5E
MFCVPADCGAVRVLGAVGGTTPCLPKLIGELFETDAWVPEDTGGSGAGGASSGAAGTVGVGWAAGVGL